MKIGLNKFTAKRLQPLKSTKEVFMNSMLNEKVEKEIKIAAKKAAFVNILISFYALFIAINIFYSLDSLDQSIPLKLYLTVPFVAVFLGLLWSRANRNPGKLLIYRTHKLLKNYIPPAPRAKWYRTKTGWIIIALVSATLWLGWLLTEISLPALFSAEGLSGAQRIFYSLVQPDFKVLPMVLEAMVVTIFLAFMATALAIPFAFILSFFCSKNLMNFSAWARLTYAVLRLLFSFTRAVEPLVWAIIFSVWVGIGPFAGMLALMLHSVASLAKLYSEQIEGVDRGPMEAIEATGANRIQVVWYSVVPQIVLPLLSFTIYRWDINIRMATIIGLVGGGGVGTLLMQFQGLARWNEVGTVILTIALVVWAMDYLSAKIREAIY